MKQGMQDLVPQGEAYTRGVPVENLRSLSHGCADGLGCQVLGQGFLGVKVVLRGGIARARRIVGRHPRGGSRREGMLRPGRRQRRVIGVWRVCSDLLPLK